MTDEIDQIVAIIQLVLPTFVVSKTVQNVAPSITVEIDSVNSHSVIKEQTYQLHIQATSAATLKTAIDTLLQQDILHPSRIDYSSWKSTALNATDSYELLLDIIPSSFETAKKSYPTLYKTNSPAEVNFVVRTLSWPVGVPIVTNSLILTLTATGNFSGVNLELYQWLLPDPPEVDDIFSTHIRTLKDPIVIDLVANVPTVTTISLSNAIDITQPNFIPILLIKNYSTEVVLSEYKYEILLQSPTTYPYELEMKYKNQQITENIFEADVLMLARWSNI